MKFLVTRVDALHDTTSMIGDNRRKINNSEVWPILVEAANHEDAVTQAYAVGCHGETKLPMNRPFLVVAMIDAAVVELKPVPQEYRVSVRPVMTG